MPVSNGTWTESWCRAGTFVAALIQVGRTDDAWQLMSQGLDPESCDAISTSCHGGPLPPDDGFSTQPGFGDSLSALGRIGLVAALETGDPEVRADALARSDDGYTSPDALLSQALDAQSDFWRAAGDLDRAAEVVDDWRQELPDDPWALHRAGELAFLAGDHDEAAADYEASLALFPPGGEYGDTAFGDHGLGSQAVDDLEGRASTGLELGAAQELGRRPGRRGGDVRRRPRRAARPRADRLRARADVLHPRPARSLALSEGDLDQAAGQLASALALVYGDEPPPGPDDEVGWGRRQATGFSVRRPGQQPGAGAGQARPR